MSLPGFPDFDSARLKALAALTARLEETFQSYGYMRVEPPMIDHADALLERSGEDTRRRAYLFDDPRGRELCLRPDLTIPVCRLALRNEMIVPDRLTRLSYAGPVFRHEMPGPGRFRQFHQAGVELLGETDPVAAEAEIVALALDSARAGGIDETLMLLGDARFFHALLDHYPLPERLKMEIRRDFLRPDRSEQKVRRSQAPSEDQRALMRSVAAIGKDEAVKLIESFLSVAEINRIGTRGIDEIVERMIDNSDDQLTKLPEEIRVQIQAFLEIENDPREALTEIAGFAQDIGVSFGPIIEDFHRRLDLMEAYGVNLADTCLCTGLSRDLDYYTGFIFELAYDGPEGIWPVGGGGRYDGLIGSLDAQKTCPAIGFGLGMERIVMATQRDYLHGPVQAAPQLHAHIAAATAQEAVAAAQAARAMRRAGWRVSVGAPGAKHMPKAAYLIALDRDPSGETRVVIRSLAENKQYKVTLAELSAFVEKTR